jgi:hypothetical protein
MLDESAKMEEFEPWTKVVSFEERVAQSHHSAFSDISRYNRNYSRACNKYALC